jgi:hypothetical protein
MIWLFKINNIVVEEPIGWDAISITAQRDPVFHGMENIVSDGLKFWGAGAQVVKLAFETDGIEAALSFDITYSCDNGVTYNTFFNGILNCFLYSIINNEVTIKIEPSGFHRLVKNRLDSPINLNSNTSIDGLPMSNINPFDLGLHSKDVVKISNQIADTSLNGFLSQTFQNNDDILSFLPLQSDVQELSDLIDITDLYTKCANSACASESIQNFFINNTTSSERITSIEVSYKLKGDFIFRPPDGEVGEYSIVGYSIYYAYGDDPFSNRSLIYFNSSPADFTLGWPDGFGDYTSKDFSFDVIGSFTIDSPYIGEKIYLYAVLETATISGGGGADNFVVTYVIDPSTNITVKGESISDPSTTKALLVHEAFAKISESITGIQDSFRSDFFGQINSQPHQYDSNGCGAWTAITNGLNIRKMKDKNSDYFPIVTTFNDLFSSCDAVWNLGMRIERDSSGKEYIRVEPKEYFYNASTILNCFNVSDLTASPATELIFNNYKVGYEKWNLNITGSNAIDEFNSDRSYILPGKMANKQLVTISKYIASGYVIEQTRRLQYLTNPSNDFETDNDLFFICTNRDRVHSDLYTTPPVLTYYEAGTVSERDENFTDISNVLSPETCYNYRISPVRMAINWYKYLAATLYKHPTNPIKFTSGTGNYQEADTMINDCIISDSIEQDENLIASNINGNNALPIYFPEILKFSYPLSYDEFTTILNNSEKAIGASCSSSNQYIGFIQSIVFRPTTDGGIADFTLLRGQCVPGDFNSDFNSDFSIGNC